MTSFILETLNELFVLIEVLSKAIKLLISFIFKLKANNILEDIKSIKVKWYELLIEINNFTG